MKKGLKNFGIGILIILGIFLSTAVVGGVITGQNLIMLTYDKVIGQKIADNKREIFKEGKAYVEGTIKDVSKLKMELEMTEDPIERKAIINHVREITANFDIDKIDNLSLKNFVREVQNGGIE